MQCRRCDEQNMPGLAACFSCGLTLGEDPPEPVATTPRVRAANPLARRAVRRAPPRWLSCVDWPAVAGRWRMVPRAMADAVLPGLSAWRAGDRRLAAALSSGSLASLALIALTWTSSLHALAILMLATAMMISAADGARRRGRLAEPWNHLVGAGVAIAAVAILWFLGGLALDTWRPRIELNNAANLAPGTYLVGPLEGSPTVNELVVVENPYRIPGGGLQVVAPVLAVAGQTVTRERRDGLETILVDGEGTPVMALNANAILPDLEAPLTVPEGHVVLYIQPLRLTRVADLGGRLIYRWSPTTERGPVPWPPESP